MRQLKASRAPCKFTIAAPYLAKRGMSRLTGTAGKVLLLLAAVWVRLADDIFILMRIRGADDTKSARRLQQRFAARATR